MKLTLGQAAKRLGLSKPTLSKHIKNGRLVAHKNEEGWYEIDAAELGRFEASYKRVAAVDDAAPAAVNPSGVTANVDLDAAVLRAQLAAIRERMDDMVARAEKAEAEAAAARAEAAAAVAKEREAWQRVAGLLEGPRPEPRAGWWARLVGR